jgi:hypothetical protein
MESEEDPLIGMLGTQRWAQVRIMNAKVQTQKWKMLKPRFRRLIIGCSNVERFSPTDYNGIL